MNHLEIKPADTKSTGVDFSPNGILTIYGVSYEEDPKVFYQRLINWAKEYVKKPANSTMLSMRLKYFNTSSSKCILEFLNVLIKIPDAEKNLRISWCYEDGDEDMQDSIRTFEELIHHKIQQIKVESYTV
jgi:hypothetical protein